MLFHPTSIKEMIAKAKNMTPIEIILAFLTGMFWTIYGIGSFILKTVSFFYGTLITLMRGSDDTAVKKSGEDAGEKAKKSPIRKY